MRWDDQQKIKEKVGGGGGRKSSEPAAASSGADDLMAEYAKSSRSKCKKCKDQIDKVKTQMCLYKKSFIAVDISSNLCGISGVKVWDHLIKGFPNLH